MHHSQRQLQVTTTGVAPGELVVASEFSWPGRGPVRCGAGPLLASVLRAQGWRVRHAPLRIPEPVEASGSAAGDSVLFACSYLDREGNTTGFAVAAGSGDRVGASAAKRTVGEWWQVLRSRRLVIADSDPWCGGAHRAVQAVRQAGVGAGRLWMVGGAAAVADHPGVRAVSGVEQVPDGGVLVLGAHGAPAPVAAQAVARGLAVVDATCPLVARVCADVRRYAARGDTVLLIGRSAHAVAATYLGQAPGGVVLVGDLAGARALSVPDPERVSFVVETGMVDRDAMAVLAVLRARFPRLRGHHFDALCHAASDRAATVGAVAVGADVLLVLGRGEDPDSQAVAAAASEGGTATHFVDGLSRLRPEWLASATTVGLVRARSAPPLLADQVREALSGLGPLSVVRRTTTTRADPPEQAAGAPLDRVLTHWA